MTSACHPHRLPALDLLIRQPGRLDDRSNCDALQHAIELLAANVDEGRAQLVLLAITSQPVLAEAICGTAAWPHNPPAADRTAQDALPEIARRLGRGTGGEPAGSCTLIDLHIALERAREALGCADAIDEGARWERETKAARAEIARLETAIADEERRLSA